MDRAFRASTGSLAEFRAYGPALTILLGWQPYSFEAT